MHPSLGDGALRSFSFAFETWKMWAKTFSLRNENKISSEIAMTSLRPDNGVMANLQKVMLPWLLTTVLLLLLLLLLIRVFHSIPFRAGILEQSMGARKLVGIRARICKRLWSPGIDSEESSSPAYVAWRASTTNTVSYRPAWLRIDT